MNPQVTPIGYPLYGNVRYANGQVDKQDYYGIRVLIIGYEIIQVGCVRFYGSNGATYDNDVTVKPAQISIRDMSDSRYSPYYRTTA